MRIAVFACANGLGHVRRVIAISTFMLKNGYLGQIDAYLPLTHIEALKGWEDRDYFILNSQVKIIDFRYPTGQVKKTKNLYDKNWSYINLPRLQKYDVVWSDNIVQVLDQRKDAILTGSFFWHEVFEEHIANNGLKEFIKIQRDLIGNANPVMAGNEYFSTRDVKSLTRFIPVGLYRYSMLFQEKQNNGLLLSCGLGGEEEDIARNAIQKIIKEKLTSPDILFVEPRILPGKYPKWIAKADFSSKMFQYCAAVCIRPGMGTISDALIGRNRIFAYFKENSFEMKHNCVVLEKLKVGQKSNDPFSAYLDAIEYIKSPDKVSNQLLRTSHLRTDGVFATANLILNKI